MNRLHNKLTLCLVLVPLLTMLSASKGLAHKVNLFISAKDGMVNTESYYPDGTKVVGGTIEVFDSQGNKLLEGETNAEGLFSFKIPKQDDLKIVLDAKMGHKTSTFIFIEELEAGIERKTTSESDHTHGPDTHTHPETKHDHGEHKHSEKEHVHETKDSKPRARKEPFPVAGVLGGLGFIFGLTALIMQLTSKKKG